MSKTSSGLIAYAKGQLGRPYWYGTFGQISTVSLYRSKKAQYPSQYDKWSEESFMEQLGVKVHDCVGLIKGYVMGNGDPNEPTPYNSKYDVSANGLFNLCQATGNIETIPEIPGLVVWKSNHIGIYLGGGKAIEARGHAYGVVITEVSKRPWTHWGKLPSSWITYDNKEDMCMIELPYLQKSSKNESVKSLQILLNGFGYRDQDGNKLGVDGSFGGKTEYAVKNFQRDNGIGTDGVVGPKTWNALLK